MTNEEAQSILHCPDTVGGLYSKKYGEALNMAMEALKKESCEDCISRQAAIEAMGEMPLNWTNSSREIAEEMMREDHVKVLKELPSVTSARSKGEWISPKVALPEEDSFVLVTINARGRRRVRSSFYMNKLFMNDNGDTWRVTDKHLVAWMYSPEPCGTETELKKKVNK